MTKISYPQEASWISLRVRESLQLEEPDSTVLLQVPNSWRLKVHTPPALDLFSGAEVHISKVTYKTILAGCHVRHQALLTTAEGVVIPVRVRKRNVGPDAILVPMSLRTLGGIAKGSEVQLSAIPKAFFRDRKEAASSRVISRRPTNQLMKLLAVSLGFLLMVSRVLDVCLESLLRAAFRSQNLTFRVIQAHPGDDDLKDTVRLHPGAFAALALRPGGQVLLSWGDSVWRFVRWRIPILSVESFQPRHEVRRFTP